MATEAMAALPEELILRIFNNLERLCDIYDVMLTCKQFHRISLDIEASMISELVINSGNDFPALRPVAHFVLAASARRLSDWSRETEERRTYLKGVIKEGVVELAIYATEVVPFTLEDIRTTWAWKRDILIPLSKRLDITCGPPSRDVDNGDVTVCEDVDLALLSWAIYGELFGHLLSLDIFDSVVKLDSVTRFRFLIYCVPDSNSFNYMCLETPRWFMNMDIERDEKFQQLSLSKAIKDTLNPHDFAFDISQLTGLIPQDVDDDDFSEPSTCSKNALFINTVMLSGRRSLEVLQMAYLARVGGQNNPADTITWLRDIWALIDEFVGTDVENLPHGRLPSTGDEWLNNHIPSIHHDSRFTLWDNLEYSLRTDIYADEERAKAALDDAIGF
jgi:hypothetical protein